MIVGLLVRLHSLDGDDLGTARAPAPVEPGDLIATADALYRVVDCVASPPGSPIGAIAKVRPEHLVVTAR
jgi:hypothetical protein